jgi:hypothetical protein
MDISPDQIRLAQIIYPTAFEKQATVKRIGMRFVHYTRANAAMNIIQKKEVWMRKSSCMNDFMEIEHGLRYVISAYNGDFAGLRFKVGLDSIFDGLSTEIESLFNGWKPHFLANTYFSCFSELDDQEDSFGGLSMWRAYSGTTGVAIVVNAAPFFGLSGGLRVYASPVAYLTDQAFEQKFLEVAIGLEQNRDFLRAQGRDVVKNHAFNTLKFASLCTKHPGFLEEREWRVVYQPTFEKSDVLTKSTEAISGTPQPVYKIPLKNIPEDGVVGIEIPEFINRIIVGPTQYPQAVREAFIDLLTDAGTACPASKVLISDIPLRC